MEDEVIYLQCPHCGTGWYGKFLGMKTHWGEHDKRVIDEYMIQGINPTNLTEPIHCLSCHRNYVPLEKEMTHELDPDYGDIECIVFKDCKLMKMSEFVAERLINCKGH